MSRAAVKRLRRLFNPAGDGIVRKLVFGQLTAAGFECHECGSVHADADEAERLHGGPGVLVVAERVVGAVARPA